MSFVEVKQFYTIVVQAEEYTRMSQCYPLELVNDMAQFYIIALKKVSARGHIEKQIPYHDGCPGGVLTGLLLFHFKALYDNAGTDFRFRLTGAQLHLCNSGNRGQRLPSEAHRSNGEQVVCFSDLTRRVLLETHTRIRRTHTATIIHYLDQGSPGILHNHTNISSTGIYGVLQQLFHHRSRALYHFPGGNLVGYRIR